MTANAFFVGDNSMVSYKVIRFKLNGKPKGILCHRRNGPCALTALYNCLHLKGKVESKRSGQRRMEEKDIKDCLKRYAAQNIEALKLTKAVSDKMRSECRTEISNLPSKPHIVPILKGMFEFQCTNSSSVYFILNVQMVHGWLVDPEDEIYESVEGFCYNDLALSYANLPMAPNVQQLLDASKHEVTAYGYRCLTQEIKDEKFHVLYWDDKFNVLYKHEGSLLMLETNEEVLTAEPQKTWKVWNPMLEDVIYLNEDFLPTRGQQHMKKAQVWHRAKLDRKSEPLNKSSTAEATSTSSSIVPMGAYIYMQIKFEYMVKGIVCHGLEGPCVLTALINSLHLKGSPFPVLAPEEQFITQNRIKEHIITILAKNIGTLLASEQYTHEELQEKKLEFEALISSLPTDLNMLPLPESCHKFKGNLGIHLFEFLDVPLYHGLSVDPTKGIYEAIKGLSIPELRLYLQSTPVEDDVGKDINSLLEAQNHIATADGLVNLQQSLEKGEVAVLYWNRSYCVIHENNGSILMLETDKDVLTTYPQAMWRILDVAKAWYCARNAKILCENVDKIQLEKQIIAASRKPIKQKHSRMHIRKRADQGDSHSSSAAAKRDSHSSAAAKGEAEESTEHLSECISYHPLEGSLITSAMFETDNPKEDLIGDSTEDSHSSPAAKGEGEESTEHSTECISYHPLEGSPSTSAMCETDNPKEHLIGDSTEDLSMVGHDFLQFLYNFKDGSSRTGSSYFVGVLASMRALASAKFYVPFGFIQKHDMRLAGKIQNHYASIRDELIAAMTSYLLGKHFESSCELEILHLPEPNSNQSFETFVENIELLEEYDVPNEGGMELSPSHEGRRMALGYLQVLVRKFKEGKCLAGNWNGTNMILRNSGLDHDIVCEDEELTLKGALADLEKFHETVLKRFSRNGTLPPYFEAFKDDILQIPDFKNEPLKWERFLMLISSPLALKAPLVRSALICNVYQVADSLRSGSPPVYVPLHTKEDLSDWRVKAKAKYLFKKVYDYDNFHSWSSTYLLDRWGCTHWSLFQYSRHFTEHVLKYTKNDEGVQLVHDLNVVDIILARCLGKYIGQAIRFLVLNCDIDGVFSAPWRHFLASECLDKQVKNVDKEIKGQEETLSEEELVKNLSCPQTIDTKVALAWLLIGIGDKDTSKIFCSPSVLANVKLEKFKNFLDANGLQAHLNDHGDLFCESVCVYKTTSTEEESLGADLIGIQGPMSEAYYKIHSLLSSWLNL